MSSMRESSQKTHTERRKHWRDRRAFPDRRNPERVLHSGYDCRNGIPRRQSDITGDDGDAEIWWNSDLF